MGKKQSFSCPNCGGQVTANAASCPHCGSDEQTGWSERTYLDGIDLNDDFDYNESFKEEFSSSKKNRVSIGRMIVAIVLLLLFVFAVLRSIF